MASSQSKARLSSSQRFNDYLKCLQEEFESNVASIKSSSARVFNIYLGHLKGEFELLSLEIESLRREKDGYKVKVGNRNICKRCSNEIPSNSRINIPSRTTRKNTFSFPRSFFRLKSRDKPTTPRRIEETTTSTQNLRSPIQPSQFVPRSQSSDDILRPEELKWSITYNNEVEKELDVVLAHALDHERLINFLKFSQDGSSLAAGCDNYKVYIYDVKTGRLTCVLGNLLSKNECLGGVLCFGGDGKYLATDTLNGNIYIWNVKTKHIRNTFKGHLKTCTSLAFSPNGRVLLSASRDNTVRLWNMRDGTAKHLAENNPTFTDQPCYSHADFRPDGKYVAASHRDGIVRIWDVRTGRLMRRVKSHSIEWVLSVKFVPDGKGLLSGGANWAGDNAVLEFWDISSLSAAPLQPTDGLHISGVEEQTVPERVFSGHKNYIISFAVSHNGLWAASGSYDDSVLIWNTRNAVTQCTLNDVHQGVRSVDFSPAGGYLASGGNDGLVRIWRIDGGCDHYSKQSTSPHKSSPPFSSPPSFSLQSMPVSSTP